MTRLTLFLTLALSAIPLTLSAGKNTGSEAAIASAVGTPLLESQDLSCRELDERLTKLTPQTYPDSPGFYTDPLRGSAVWVATLWSPAWAYVGYTGLRDEYRQGRIEDVRTEMERLRQLKARRHCYER